MYTFYFRLMTRDGEHRGICTSIGYAEGNAGQILEAKLKELGSDLIITGCEVFNVDNVHELIGGK